MQKDFLQDIKPNEKSVTGLDLVNYSRLSDRKLIRLLRLLLEYYILTNKLSKNLSVIQIKQQIRPGIEH